MAFQIGSGVGVKDLVTFTRLFATMIDAGLPLVQCLEILANQQQNKIFAGVLRDVKNNVEGGSSFSDALKRHPKVFDELFVNLVHAGEVGGILDTIMSPSVDLPGETAEAGTAGARRLGVSGHRHRESPVAS